MFGVIASIDFDWRKSTLSATLLYMSIWAVTCDFQQCGIMISVDTVEAVQPLLSLETPNDVRSVA